MPSAGLPCLHGGHYPSLFIYKTPSGTTLLSCLQLSLEILVSPRMRTLEAWYFQPSWPGKHVACWTEMNADLQSSTWCSLLPQPCPLQGIHDTWLAGPRAGHLPQIEVISECQLDRDSVFMAQTLCRRKGEGEIPLKKEETESHKNPFSLQDQTTYPHPILPHRHQGLQGPGHPGPHQGELTPLSGFARREKMISLWKVPVFCPKGLVLVNSDKGWDSELSHWSHTWGHLTEDV